MGNSLKIMKKEIKARISEDFHAQLEEAIYRKRSSQQAAIVEALTVWMDAPVQEPKAKPGPTYSREQQTLIDQLVYFLETAAEDDVRVLKAMLAANMQMAKNRQKAKLRTEEMRASGA